MNRSMAKLTVMIFAAIFLSTYASYAQSEYWDGSGYQGSGSNSDDNGWQADGVTDSDYSSDPSSEETDSWESPRPAEISEPSEGAYFPSSISESPSILVDETTSYQYSQANVASDASVMYGGSYPRHYAGTTGTKDIFWIISKDGTKHWRSVNILCHHYARMLIIPSTSGQLVMQEKYPDGQVKTYYFGNVMEHKQYRVWFFADTSGIHRMRYRIDNGPYSDILTFHVIGNCGGGGKVVCKCCGRPY
jgi:hypothetical protein